MSGGSLTPNIPEFFYPNRFRKARPFIKRFVNLYPNLPTMPTQEQAKGILDLFGDTVYRPEIMRRPLDERPAIMHKWTDEYTCILRYLQFSSAGRNIFYLAPALVEMLKRTSAEDVPLGFVPFPYRFFHISFGLQEEFHLGEGFFVDGAYVGRTEISDDINIEVHLTTIRKDIDYRSNLSWLDIPNKYYYLPLQFTGEKTVRQACEKAFDEELKLHSKKIESIAGMHEVEGRTVTLFDRREKTQEEQKAHVAGGFSVFREAVQLIMNSICYLGFPEREVSIGHIEGAPIKLLEKLESADTSKKKRKISLMLESMGYTRIHFCGKIIQSQYEFAFSGREVKPHWRRGHWRNQAYGTGLSERRLLWIMPTIVRPDKGQPEKGHIYELDK